MRKKLHILVEPNDAKAALLKHCEAYKYAAFLDAAAQSNAVHRFSYSRADVICAIGAIDVFEPTQNVFQNLKHFIDYYQDYAFGHFSYDLKNQVENLSSHNTDELSFPLTTFFIPLVVAELKGNELTLFFHADTAGEKLANEILVDSLQAPANPFKGLELSIGVESRISEAHYLAAFNVIQEHIYRGDIYEINYCQEFFARHVNLNPIELFQQLTRVSPAPFSAYYKVVDNHVACASPERFLAKRGSKLISQPIKGTAKRGATIEADFHLKEELSASYKNKKENVMIVDLVRNDLSHSAENQSVQVEELYGVYSFSHVHQMISTVTSQLKAGVHPVEAIMHCFPMGSMTGAPKVRAMQIIEEIEVSKRGIYSGAIGYFTPQLDFDFNVVIRSLVYNAANQYLSFMVGGAITHLSTAQEEYQECLLKAKGILQTLGATNLLQSK